MRIRAGSGISRSDDAGRGVGLPRLTDHPGRRYGGVGAGDGRVGRVPRVARDGDRSRRTLLALAWPAWQRPCGRRPVRRGGCTHLGTTGPVRQYRPGRREPALVRPGRNARHVPVLATYFSVRRGRDPFFKFFMRRLPAPGEGLRGEVRDQVHRLVQRRPRLGLRQRDPARPARLRAPSTSSKRTKRPAPSATGPASGSSNATTRCSFGSGWAPISSTTVELRRRDGRRRSMDASRNDLLGEFAADAALERSDFLVQATEQLRKFLDATQRADHGARRPDPHRRGPGLPRDRART